MDQARLEVAEASVTNLDLGDYGTMATIVDWDQLPNGLLGITIEGTQRFHIEEVWREDSGLNMARVDIEPSPDAVEIPEEGRSMIDVWLDCSVTQKCDDSVLRLIRVMHGTSAMY